MLKRFKKEKCALMQFKSNRILIVYDKMLLSFAGLSKTVCLFFFLTCKVTTLNIFCFFIKMFWLPVAGLQIKCLL